MQEYYLLTVRFCALKFEEKQVRMKKEDKIDPFFGDFQSAINLNNNFYNRDFDTRMCAYLSDRSNKKNMYGRKRC